MQSLERGMTARILPPFFLAAFLLSGSWAISASAQAYFVASYDPYSVPVFYGYPYYGSYPHFYGGYHSSTVVEGYLRGRAELIQARGIASLYYAQALREQEEARSLYLENRMANFRYHAERRELRADEVALRREQVARRRESRQRSQAERDAANGARIDWPAELMAKQYESIRTEIEALVKLRGELGENAGEATTLAIRHAVRELAKQVVDDERSDRWSEERSKVVRQFVRELNDEPTRPSL
jgi:hypothetical protein